MNFCVSQVDKKVEIIYVKGMGIDKTLNPNQIFDQWFKEAKEAGVVDPTAMTLATASPEGWASARIVLLKKHTEKGFYFFTNYESDKAQQLIENPKAALVFHWRLPSHRQIRIRGTVEKLGYEESNAYFQSRGRGSQVGAWASQQSREIQSREELLKRAQDIEEKYKDKEIPCPEHWGGFCIQPLVIEFWEEQEHRLHDRFHFFRSSLSDSWSMKRLAP